MDVEVPTRGRMPHMRRDGDYRNGFRKALEYWQWINDYRTGRAE